MSKKYEKAEQWQIDKVAPLIYCTFASTDIAVNLTLTLIEEIRKRGGLMRHEVKMLCGNIMRNIHAYQRGCEGTMGEYIGVLADFNDGMDGHTANSVEILRLTFGELFARSGCTDPGLCSHAETAVSLCEFADRVFDEFCRESADAGLVNPRYTTVAYMNNRALLRDTKAVAAIIYRLCGVPHADFNGDGRCAAAFDAVTRRLLDGRRLHESYLRAEALAEQENGKEGM